MVELSPLTKQHVAALFGLTDVAAAELLLARECAENLPLIGDPTPTGLERLRFAAIRISDGKVSRLRDAVDLAKTDWRDLLVASDFADDVEAHRKWQPRRLDLSTVDRWMTGELPADVKFALNAPVEIRFGPRPGSVGVVVNLVGLEPEPRYLIELGSGEDVEARQSLLQDAG